jgi:MOSC domain-containing protein YiiM
MDEPRMAALLVEHHRPGFYFRVLEEGEVGAGDEIVNLLLRLFSGRWRNRGRTQAMPAWRPLNRWSRPHPDSDR